MKKNTKRILFFAETVTLAHIARCIVIAKALHATERFVVALAADKRFDSIIDDNAIKRFPLTSISCQQFSEQLRKGKPLYDGATLVKYVEDDLAIIDQFKPDFIFGDFRLSLFISCRLAKIPYATITNAYWSPYADINYPIPEIFLTKILGVNLAQKLFDLVRPVVFWTHSLAFNQTCKRFGLSPVSYDMRDVYTQADFTLYADIESLFSMRSLPNNHVFIGPVLWSADVPLPGWWGALPEKKPIIFITLGSSGDVSLLPMLLKILGEMDVTVMCVTAKKTRIETSYPNVYVADFLPAESAVKKADIVICNGGSPMVYQSLVENKAIIGIPSNLDQYLMMTTLQRAGKGQMIRASQITPCLIKLAVNQALQLKLAPLEENAILTINKIIDLIDVS